MATKNKKAKKSKKSEEKGSILIILLVMVLAAIIVFGGLVIRDQLQEKEKTENETSDINTAPLYDDNKDDSNTDGNEDGNAIYDEKGAYDASQNDNEVEHSENGMKIAKTILNINQNDRMIIFSARVTNFLETGGKCDYILTKGTEMVTYTKDVLPDPKTTVCEALVLEKSSLSAGEWQIKVEYRSEDAEGASETQSFKM